MCDIKNIREIFHNRFGANVDFTGYIDKFYSKEIFYYDVRDMVVNALVNIINNDLKSVNDSDLPSIKDKNLFLKNALKYMVDYFMKFNQINLRALLKLKKVNLEPERKKFFLEEDSKNIYNNNVLIIRVLEIWKSVFGDLSKLKQAVENTEKRMNNSGKLIDIETEKKYERDLIANAIILLDYKNHKFNENTTNHRFDSEDMQLKFDYELSKRGDYFFALMMRPQYPTATENCKLKVNYFSIVKKNIEVLEEIGYLN